MWLVPGEEFSCSQRESFIVLQAIEADLWKREIAVMMEDVRKVRWE